MTTAAPGVPTVADTARGRRRAVAAREGGLLRWIPRGNLLDDAAWRQRHRILEGLLAAHLPALALFGLFMDRSAALIGGSLAPVAVCLLLGAVVRQRRVASFFVTAGLVTCSAVLVAFSGGVIEAHFHFFVMIPFIALYQDWVPFIWEIVFVVLSHGLGAQIRPDLMFNTHAGIHNPWTWSLIHGVAVLAACAGMVLYWRTSEDEQQKNIALNERLAQAELARRRFVSDLLVKLARRNQSLLYRQLDIINQLEDQEEDPDALAELFRLDHLATRIRRNAENLLVLSGDEPPRVWSRPIRLGDVVRAAIAETEDLDRVVFVVDERLAVLGHAVADLTHLLAELIENAVRSSPPDTRVTIRSSPDVRSPGSVVLTVEDWGIGMPPDQLAAANEVLAAPSDVDAVSSSRLGLHVVSRLARRWNITAMLTVTPGSGVTAVVMLPPEMFAGGQHGRAAARGTSSGPATAPPPATPQTGTSRPPSQWAPREELSRPEPPATAAAPVIRPDPAPPAAAPAPVNAHPLDGETPPNGIAVARAAASGSASGSATAPDAEPPLRRRTPQAHMAPQLRRRPAAPQAAPARTSGTDAARAREALSRYQASRREALSRRQDDGDGQE